MITKLPVASFDIFVVYTHAHTCVIMQYCAFR